MLLFRIELCIHRYSFVGFKFSCGIPTEFVYEGLMVLPELVCTDDGEMFQTASLPIPFGVFCRGFAPAADVERKPKAVHPKSVVKTAKENIKGKHSWLTEEDMKAPDKMEDDGDDDDEDTDGPDDGVDADLLLDELRDVRDEVHGDDDETDDPFYVYVRGGPGLIAAEGISHRFIVMLSRKGMPRDDFCSIYALPRWKHFNTFLYTLHGAKMLARAWASQGNYCCRLWFAAGAMVDYVFDEDAVFEDEAYLDWAAAVDIADPCFDRITEINAWKPSLPSSHPVDD